MYELRYYINPRHYEIIGQYNNRILAYGMRKKKAAEPNLCLKRLKVVEV